MLWTEDPFLSGKEILGFKGNGSVLVSIQRGDFPTLIVIREGSTTFVPSSEFYIYYWTFVPLNLDKVLTTR